MSSGSESPPPYGGYPQGRPVPPAPMPGQMAPAPPVAPAGAADEEAGAATVRWTAPGAGPSGYPPPGGYQAAAGGYPGAAPGPGGYPGAPGGYAGQQPA